ncbi:Asp-tRNA(Asn)/Glu-tRNA(Gln) amidotransferase GatCAB subunit A [Calothrix sp. PCC 6303]|uniref:AtzE family amidohydrolase n=1 Tax=Calothrix sp. PCC 6303 TaxID=1170562 RepID=UPI0002A05826|nr:Asp-tRNA(Asn)/Glu-tRNA(Gln) amidotransferase GatCAB subunit A [Calothrix sp. PCC 6303]AFZ00265.1 amidohydrolase, AtzE family [Calothrix sp. PCC 6303]
MNLDRTDAVAIASAVQTGKIAASQVIQRTLHQIQIGNKQLNCFTAITTESAFLDAERIDREIAAGKKPGVLAGVPFAVKNLFDIQGLTTLAGAKINSENPPATQDATAITKLKEAGAVLVGALNMDEYAYGFVTENSHYGTTHNPHDITRIAGGSSGGSAAAVAAGLVPISLGSDTNGSIRVPAALCGIYGLKPTYGRLSRGGVKLFSASFDHIGGFSTSIRDIAVIFDVLQGVDSRDPICSQLPPVKTQHVASLNNIDGIKIAIASEYFSQKCEPEALAAVQKVADALGVKKYVSIPESHRARAAAFIITAVEGANLHFHNLKHRPQDFDPATRDRFLAGTLIPSQWYIQAQRFRRWYQNEVREIFQHVDVIIAPTTPIAAPLIGQETMLLDGEEILVRPYLGQFTQPLSFIGLPVLSVPIKRTNALPLGVQIIAAPHHEAKILQVAGLLEKMGVISATVVGN